MKAPFTDDQVNSMNSFQSAGVVHPFTCSCGAGALIATTDGWICPKKCGYSQDWAHDCMTNWEWKTIFPSYWEE